MESSLLDPKDSAFKHERRVSTVKEDACGAAIWPCRRRHGSIVPSGGYGTVGEVMRGR